MDRFHPKRDNFKLFVRIMDIIVWIIILAAFLLLDQARPETRTLLDIRYSKDVRESWDYGFASISMWLFILSTIICTVGLFINLPFLRNRKYHISYGMLFGLIISLGASIAYVFILL